MQGRKRDCHGGLRTRAYNVRGEAGEEENGEGVTLARTQAAVEKGGEETKVIGEPFN